MTIVNIHTIEIQVPCHQAILTIKPEFFPYTNVHYKIGAWGRYLIHDADQWTTTASVLSCPDLYYEFV